MSAVERAIAHLADGQREAITLYAYETMTYEEIAHVLGVPINTVKTLIYRARAELARTLGRDKENDRGM